MNNRLCATILALSIAFFGVAPQVLADPTRNPPLVCAAKASCSTCPTKDGCACGCILVTLDLGATTAWTGQTPVYLRIHSSDESASLSTPAQLKVVMGWSFKAVDGGTTAGGAPQIVRFVQPEGAELVVHFQDGDSVGVPEPNNLGKSLARVQMVDAEGWATTSAPAFYDLYPGDGSVWRFLATGNTNERGALASFTDPRGRVLTPDDFGVDIVRDALGNIRQVKTLTRLADVRTLSPTHYAVTVYPLAEEPEQVADTGLYALPEHAPTRVLDVAQGESVKELLVGFQKGTGDMRQYRYVAVNGDWTLHQPSGLVEAQELYFTEDESGAQRLHTIRDETGKLWSRDEYNYVSAYWGYLITNRIEGIPGDATRTTSWSYYTDGPHKDLLRETVEPTGNRIVYEYDAQNRVVRESMPLVEEETLYSYEPVDPSDPPLLCDTRPRCVVRKMQGVEIQRTYYVYGTNGVDVVERVGEQGAAYGGTNVLRTVTTYYPVTGAITDGLVQSVRHEDGTIDNYAYGLANGIWTETITHVHEQAPNIVPMRTTRSVRVYNALGRLVDSRTDLCTIGVEDLVPQADWTPIERLQYAYDIDGNEIRREDLAGRLWTAEWAGNCCGKISETDWQGITTTYAYDIEGRIIAKQTGSILTETAYDALGRATNVARRGIATADRPAATVHPSSFAYDSLGRETMGEGEDGIRRLFSYSYRPEGGEVLTVIEAPGTDCERVTTTVSDAAGQTISELRNGALRRTIVYAPFLETVYEGSKGTNSLVWTARKTDLFGRVVETSKPGFGGSVRHSCIIYDFFGHIVETENDYTSAESESERVVTGRRFSFFNEFGNLILSSEDVNRNGQIDLVGPDIVISNELGYAIAGGFLWATSETFVFPNEGSPRSVSTGRSQTRLTGLGATEETEAIGNAILTSEVVMLDILGNATTERQFVNRETRDVLDTRQLPISTVSQETVTDSGVTFSFRSSENVTTTNRYDALFRHVATIDLFGNATTTAYDEFGRVAWREDPSGARTSFGYDALGRQVSVTDALGNEKTTTFDMDSNAVSLRGSQYPVDYTYDEYGRMATMSTYRTEDLVHGDVTTWLRDEATGLVTNKVYADGNGQTYAYTPDGKPTRTVWARGAWFENVYDPQGRVVQVLHDDATFDAEMGYDRLGRLVSSSVPAASYRYALDLLGHATNEVVVIAGATNTILRHYDALGRQTRLQITDSDYDESFVYDNYGRLSVIGNPGSIITYAYTPDSRDSGYSVLTPSNAVLTRALTRDPLRRGLIASVSNLVNGVDSGSSFDYTYDALGRPVARNLNAFFGYDDLGQVVFARFGEAPDLYNYDLIGNFTSNRLRGAWLQFMANKLNEYTAISTRSPPPHSTFALAYDPDGNLLTNGVWSYAYDSMNRLSAVASNGVVVAENDYDALWRRVVRRTRSAEHRYLYDDWNPIRESVSHGDGTANRDYHWGKDLSGTFQGAGGVGGLLAVSRADRLFLPFYDNLGNGVAYADATGSVVAAYAYDVFGRTISTEGSLAEIFTHGFSTKLLDPETGLHYYGYRFYDSRMGRWMNRDPFGEIEGDNLFCFVLNHGIHSWDYLGLTCCKGKTRNCTVGITTVRSLGDPNVDAMYQDYLESMGPLESILTLSDVAKLSIAYLTLGTEEALKQLTQYLMEKSTMSSSQITEIGKNLFKFYQRRGKETQGVAIWTRICYEQCQGSILSWLIGNQWEKHCDKWVEFKRKVGNDESAYFSSERDTTNYVQKAISEAKSRCPKEDTP